ncbi:ABC transporter permease [Xylanibacillus composti]|uniref:Putative aliphatic sulfonates transport permease protein SsuC n=1 Tax=Xylanibacillus composti TaxID=1572762 RepID=A0A8J4H6F7_9BACL|nr:ABC transporter permease [Xylanibacillus composti]MDT9726990.1 ABC transporter permease [Xylanibacillus composti]GIQ69548.1 putative aliphatic sulfonates transport permease protein SsuC [Xylanibacillus composti]
MSRTDAMPTGGAATISGKTKVKSEAPGKHRQEKLRAAVQGLILPASILASWQLAGTLEWISPIMLPAPSAIFMAFVDLTASGELFSHLQISVYRAALGFALGGGLGLLLGMISGLFRRAEQTVDPTLQMLRMIPHLAITPLFILWFGFGELSKILLIAKGAFFPLYVNTFLGIRNADAKLFDVARVLEFNRWKQITRLVLPSAMPNILLGLRLSLGIAWLGLVVAELMGSSEGVGYLIMDARQFSQTAIVFVGIIIFAVVGKLTDSVVRYLEKRLLRWRDSFTG